MAAGRLVVSGPALIFGLDQSGEPSPHEGLAVDDQDASLGWRFS